MLTSAYHSKVKLRCYCSLKYLLTSIVPWELGEQSGYKHSKFRNYFKSNWWFQYPLCQQRPLWAHTNGGSRGSHTIGTTGTTKITSKIIAQRGVMLGL